MRRFSPQDDAQFRTRAAARAVSLGEFRMVEKIGNLGIDRGREREHVDFFGAEQRRSGAAAPRRRSPAGARTRPADDYLTRAGHNI